MSGWLCSLVVRPSQLALRTEAWRIAREGRYAELPALLVLVSTTPSGGDGPLAEERVSIVADA